MPDVWLLHPVIPQKRTERPVWQYLRLLGEHDIDMQHVSRLGVRRVCVAQQCMVTAAALHACRYALAELRAAVLAYVKASFFLMHRTSLGGGFRVEDLGFVEQLPVAACSFCCTSFTRICEYPNNAIYVSCM